MSSKTKKSKPDKQPRSSASGQLAPQYLYEVWGLLFLAIGVLVTVALISGFISPERNILGAILGTALWRGLVFFFGSVCAMAAPVMLLLSGICYLLKKPLPAIVHAKVAGIVALLCVLLAIPNMGISHDPSFVIEQNLIGNSVVFLFYYLFGAATFGPWFIVSVALLITILLSFRLSLLRLFHLCIIGVKLLGQKLRNKASRVFARKQPGEAEPVFIAEAQSVDPAVKEPQNAKKTQEPASEKSEQGVSDAEDDAKKMLEEQLAAFRARKNEPVKITTEQPEEPPLSPVIIQQPASEEDALEEQIGPEADFEAIPADLTAEQHEDDHGHFKPDKPKLPHKPYKIPSPSLLQEPPPRSELIDREKITRNSETLENTLLNFNVEGKVVNVAPGPVITRYEIELAPGIKVSRVINLQDDISMAVGGKRIRIQAPIPGKAAIGIELPNADRQIVYFKHVLCSEQFRKSKAKIPVVIGQTISGAPFITDIAKMPHVLIAGQTGSGKSVCINSLICSMLMTKKPDELRLIMIDPKKVELASYEGIPHLLSPVVTESKEAVKALQWGCIEMERRYRLLAKVGARNLESFNARVSAGSIKEGVIDPDDNKQMPFIVIIVDELADLMMTASRDVEGLIQRIAQLARAVGIHLVVATQRPSVDIITGPIKANLTSRISFRTIQSTDSRTILGHVGAEKLLGMGDLLFLRNGAPDIERFHGAFLSEEDVERIVEAIAEQYVEVDRIESFEAATSNAPPGTMALSSDDDGRDELFEQAAEIIVSLGQGSTSLLQRRMKIGYARAGRLMDELEKAGLVGPQEGSKARDVLVTAEEFETIKQNWHSYAK